MYQPDICEVSFVMCSWVNVTLATFHLLRIVLLSLSVPPPLPSPLLPSPPLPSPPLPSPPSLSPPSPSASSPSPSLTPQGAVSRKRSWSMPMHHQNAINRGLGAPQISISSPDDPLQSETCEYSSPFQQILVYLKQRGPP